MDGTGGIKNNIAFPKKFSFSAFKTLFLSKSLMKFATNRDEVVCGLVAAG